MATLRDNRYGKSGVRLVKVTRNGSEHTLREWTVRVLLEGDFEKAHTHGDNSKILPTDTMKNTVYSRAKESTAESIEEFAEELASFLLGRNSQVSACEVSMEQALWKRIVVDGKPHDHSFMHGSNEVQTATVRIAKDGSRNAVSGLTDMVILKTTRSSFEGFIRDEFTTLKEAADRLLGTSVTAEWTYAVRPAEFDDTRVKLRDAMLTTFAQHDSRSVQQTLYAMAEAALSAAPQVSTITLTMPNIHNVLVDLKVFGQENANEIFMPISDPSGYIQATVTRN